MRAKRWNCLRKVKKIFAGAEGFTFVELMVTAAVVSIVLLGFVSGNMAIQRTSDGAFERAVAVQDANRVVERIRDAAKTGQFPGNVTGTFPNNATVGGFNALDSEQVRVNYADSSANPLDVTVTVTWMQNGTRQAAEALRTFVTQR